MTTSPREALLAVPAIAFAEAISEIGGRVGVMRTEPIWGEEELPIILIDIDGERGEVHSTAPLWLKQTLSLSFAAYCAGDNDEARLDLIRMIDSIRKVMREWQYITVGDVDPDAAEDERDRKIVESIRPGMEITYFTAANGTTEHVAARLAYDGVFFESHNSDGKEHAGTPKRNIIGDFREMLVKWRPKNSSLTVMDQYQVKED
jgi:hypothetical protein